MAEFLLNNAVLVALVVVSAAMLAWPLVTRNKRAKEVDNTLATDLINHENAQVVDVRSASDFRSGHLAGSVNIPATVIQNKLGELDKRRPVLLVSATGDASMPAGLLRGVGFASVAVLKGGIRAWREANLPLVKR